SLRRYYGSVRPSAPRRYSRLAVFAAWASPLASERLVPAVPRKSLHPLPAPSTPVAVCPVIRPPTDLSQKGFTLLVLTTLASLRRVFEGFTFVRLSDAHLHEIDLALFSNAHDHGSLPQQLGVVWDRLLKTDSEGPTLISHAA